MKTKQLKPEDLNLFEIAQKYSDKEKARKLLETLRWPNGPVCPHCKNDGKAKSIYALVPKEGSKTRAGVYKCGACRKQFTVTVGTIFADSKIPLGKWLMAVFLLCSSKKAMSAHQLHRMLGVTYKTAWFMAHRIRYAMSSNLPLGKLLKGVVECDETYVGGKGDNRTRAQRHTPVVALIERDGNVKTKVIANITQRNMRRVLTEEVCKTATVNMDESSVYLHLAKDFARHDKVNHSKMEYTRFNADGTVSMTNTCESFFSLLKRGVYGSWHHVSREHLAKYAGEFAFRWNTRKVTDGERMASAISLIEGKRLTYRQAI